LPLQKFILGDVIMNDAANLGGQEAGISVEEAVDMGFTLSDLLEGSAVLRSAMESVMDACTGAGLSIGQTRQVFPALLGLTLVRQTPGVLKYRSTENGALVSVLSSARGLVDSDLAVNLKLARRELTVAADLRARFDSDVAQAIESARSKNLTGSDLLHEVTRDLGCSNEAGPHCQEFMKSASADRPIDAAAIASIVLRVPSMQKKYRVSSQLVPL
jgi:hypothetical protein